MSDRLLDITYAEAGSPELELAEHLHAGFPSPAADYNERIDITKELIHHPETTFYARIDGDSMQEAGIFSGDIVVIDRSIKASDGNYVAAYIDGEFTVKEYRTDPNGKCAWLIPHNPKYNKIKVTEDNAFVIWGVITHTIHPLANV
ncbi:MAG: translesion error-prone DNA polymerase V autoproteolytic subunit [Paludibacteraceae bacterium]|nr:translesion error-prone DNA polymerase V autoproteolytic subunit [Paludibacteraceae bacterium]